ncbi:hypothetical protein PGQ11_000069 [Apiospora arundinis]
MQLDFYTGAQQTSLDLHLSHGMFDDAPPAAHRPPPNLLARRSPHPGTSTGTGTPHHHEKDKREDTGAGRAPRLVRFSARLLEALSHTVTSRGVA